MTKGRTSFQTPLAVLDLADGGVFQGLVFHN